MLDFAKELERKISIVVEDLNKKANNFRNIILNKRSSINICTNCNE